MARESSWGRWLSAAPQPLTSGPLLYQFFGSSTDGSGLLALVAPRAVSQGGTLMRYDPESQLFEPALGGESAYYAEPSPDGEWLAWVRYPEGTLWRSRPDGSDRLQLTNPPAVVHLPRWSPDGRRIVFVSQPDPSALRAMEIRVVAADGSEGGLIARPENDDEPYWDACWLPDESIVLSHSGEPAGLLRWDPVSRKVEPVPGAESLLWQKCSGQGDVFAVDPVRGVGKVRRWGRTEWRDVGQAPATYPNWTRDGRSVCGLDWPAPLRYRIACLDVEDGQLRVLADTSPLELVVWTNVPWMGLDAEDRPLVTVAGGSKASTIYALDWDAP